MGWTHGGMWCDQVCSLGVHMWAVGCAWGGLMVAGGVTRCVAGEGSWCQMGVQVVGSWWQVACSVVQFGVPMWAVGCACDGFMVAGGVISCSVWVCTCGQLVVHGVGSWWQLV